jgi:NADH dehydrogenase (ubiquinone) Fe-S protein 6
MVKPLHAPETIAVPADANEVACDGGNGPLGHPLVYYSFDGKTAVTCGYCDRVFQKTGR